MKVVRKKQFTEGMISVLLSQTFSIFVSFVLGFIVPKFIDEYQYAYWQAFILYYGYVAIANFGMLDGFILRYSQYDYDELDKRKACSFFKTLMIWVTFIAIFIAIISACFFFNEYKWIGLLVSLGIIIRHFWAYNYDIFQTTNRMNLYARLTIVQRAVYVVIIIVLIALEVNNFIYYCLAELFGEVVAAFLSVHHNRGLFLGKGISWKENINEIKLNMSAGILLLIANLAANFIVGGAKIVIQLKWGALIFGKVSFSFSLTNIFLSFVTAISIVLFPTLKRLEVDRLSEMYYKIKSCLSPILFFALLLYYPLCWILRLWLPKYNESLVYLGILLPLIIYTATVSLLTNNYLKVYRKEREMLIINVITVLISIGIFLMIAYLLDSLSMLLSGVVISVIFRSYISEYIVMKVIDRKMNKSLVEEIVLTIIFVFSVQLSNQWIGCLFYLFALVLYLIINICEIKEMLQRIFSTLKGL